MAERLTRTFRIDPDDDGVDDLDEDSDDAYDVSLSSEEPVDRWFGREILSHDDGAVNLERAKDGLPLLASHDERALPIGRLENLHTAGKRLRARMRFFSTPRGQEAKALVEGGHREMSVGYNIDEYDVTPGKADEPSVYRATRWTPLEGSLVSVPADHTIGVGRSAGAATSRRISVSDESLSGLSRSQRAAARSAADRELAAANAASNRAAEIAALAQRHGMADRVSGWLSSGASLEQVRGEILEARASRPMRMPCAEELERSHRESGGVWAREQTASPIPPEELRHYSLLRAIRSTMPELGRHVTREAGFELECSRVLADHCGRQAKGLLVPEEIVFGFRGLSPRGFTRGMTVGTPSAGGDLVATNLLAAELIETLNNQPQVIALGARRLSGLVGNAAIPRMTAGDAVHWIAEGADYGDTQPTFDQPQLTPHDLAARVDISRRLLLQSTPAADAVVRDDLALRIGIGIDAAAVNGSGSAGQPTGLLNSSGLPLVALGTNGAAPTWDAMTQVVQTVAAANGLRGAIGWLVPGAAQGTLMRTPLVSGFPRFIWEAAQPGARPDEGTIAGYRALVSNNVPSNLTKGSGTNLSALLFGNWTDVIIGEWRGLDILADPYSQSATGTLRITAIHTCDILIRHVASFCAIEDCVTT